MSVGMAIWRMTESGPVRLQFSALDLESRLEDMILADPTLVGLDVLVIGRQVPTTYGGFVDLVAVDVDGHLHLLDLKRDRTPREVVAQLLDYGSWAQGLSLQDISEIYAAKNNAELDDAFADRFASPLPDVVNADQQLTIIASELDPASDRIVEYLAERYGVPINAVFFRHFADRDDTYLARTWLLEPEEITATTTAKRSTKQRPWNGRDFYVVLGNLQKGTDRWDFARRYGLIGAGGGSWYSKPLRNLTPGKRVFAYVGGAGYVGVGNVTGEVLRAADAEVNVDGHSTPLLDLPDLPGYLLERAPSHDPEVTEYVVPVEWAESRPATEAISAPGLFASQVTVCKLRDERTVGVLTDAFSLDDS